MEQTLVIVKPDGVQRGLIGEIVTRLERRGLKIVAMEMRLLDRAIAEEHYGEHRGKPFYAGLVEYITSSPSVLLAFEGPVAIDVVRTTVGDTKPSEAKPGTIRADYGLTIGRNLIHASDKPESAARELRLFFGEGGTLTYERAIDRWLLED